MLVVLGSRCASDLASDSFALKPRQNLSDYTRALLVFRALFLQGFTSCRAGKRQECVCSWHREGAQDGAGLEPGGTVPPSTQPGEWERGSTQCGVGRAGHFTCLSQRTCIVQFLRIPNI